MLAIASFMSAGNHNTKTAETHWNLFGFKNKIIWLTAKIPRDMHLLGKYSWSFTQWNPAIPFTIVARYGGNPDSLISTEAVKPYRAAVSEISIHLPAMPWIRGFNTRCFRGQYRSPMLYTFKFLCCEHHRDREKLRKIL